MTGTPATIIGKLNTLGYELYLDGDKVKYRYTLLGDPPADRVKPLLYELREHKEEIITQLKFKQEFNKLSEHLQQRDYAQDNMARLQELACKMDDAWESTDYSLFKEIIEKMSAIPSILKPEGMRPIGAKIYSHILQDTVWVAIDPTFQANDGIPVYYPEEIQNLKGATPDEVQAVHRVKKEFGGKLIVVNQRGEG